MQCGRMTLKKPALLICFLLAATVRGEEKIVAVAHPEDKLPERTTVVWSPLFQAAWDKLHAGLGKPVKVEPPNALMERLDQFAWDAESVMPRDHWKVWAGEATQKFIDQANAEAARMTGEKTGPFKIEPRPDSRIALGLLDRDLVFKKPLHRSLAAPLEFHTADGNVSKVRFFGTRRKASAEYGGTVKVLSYQKGSHALQISSDEGDAVVLYLPDQPQSLGGACGTLRELRKNPLKGKWGSTQDPSLHENDDVRIPVLSLENKMDFVPQLAGLHYFKSGPPWQIYKAEQRTKFQLTEKGAKVRVEVELGIDPFGVPPPKPVMTPRFFHYDRPFFVFLWRDGAEWPYFGAWIGNDAAMQAFTPAK